MSDRPPPSDLDEFIKKWDDETEALITRIMDRFGLLTEPEVREIVLESLALGVAINEDAAKRAAVQVLNEPRKNN